MAIDADEVRHIAALAKLELSPAELEHFRHQLQSILDYVAMLDELDVDDVPPTERPHSEGQPGREDRVAGGVSQQEAVSNAPGHAAGHFHVPKVIEG